jgi:Protein of unknown function (DUF2809)
MKPIKFNYLCLSMLLLITEILIAIFAKDEFIRPILGDYLAALFVFYLLASFLKISETKTALLALSICYFIEGLQFLNILEQMNLEKYTVLKIVLGTSFSWMDMLAYTLGIITVLLIHNRKKVISLSTL